MKWIGEYTNEKQNELKKRLINQIPKKDWIVVADSDELHDFPDVNLIHLFRKCENDKQYYIEGYFHDRLAENGILKRVLSYKKMYRYGINFHIIALV